ncbi:MAG: hypothetical protein ACKPHU_15020, partial [Planctomycetaceae bacterium]
MILWIVRSGTAERMCRLSGSRKRGKQADRNFSEGGHGRGATDEGARDGGATEGSQGRRGRGRQGGFLATDEHG